MAINLKIKPIDYFHENINLKTVLGLYKNIFLFVYGAYV
jgi:hypothetical protein